MAKKRKKKRGLMGNREALQKRKSKLRTGKIPAFQRIVIEARRKACVEMSLETEEDQRQYSEWDEYRLIVWIWKALARPDINQRVVSGETLTIADLGDVSGFGLPDCAAEAHFDLAVQSERSCPDGATLDDVLESCDDPAKARPILEEFAEESWQGQRLLSLERN